MLLQWLPPCTMGPPIIELLTWLPAKRPSYGCPPITSFIDRLRDRGLGDQRHQLHRHTALVDPKRERCASHSCYYTGCGCNAGREEGPCHHLPHRPAGEGENCGYKWC